MTSANTARVSPQENGQLLLASQPHHGKCRRECRTVEKACDTVIDKADTEFTEILYNGVKEGLTDEQVTRYICNRAAGVCKKKTPKITSRAFDEKFEILTDEEKQMLDMQATTTTPQQQRHRPAAFGITHGWRVLRCAQANLKDTGMSGTMYRREDLAGMMDKLGHMGDMGGMGGMEGMDGMEGYGYGDEPVPDVAGGQEYGDDVPDYDDTEDGDVKLEL